MLNHRFHGVLSLRLPPHLFFIVDEVQVCEFVSLSTESLVWIKGRVLGLLLLLNSVVVGSGEEVERWESINIELGIIITKGLSEKIGDELVPLG